MRFPPPPPSPVKRPDGDGPLRAGSFHSCINPKTHQPQQRYDLAGHQRVVIARKKDELADQVALRLRVGRKGYSQWLNEMSVYLLPKFEHQNILPLLGYDKRIMDESDDSIFNCNIMKDDDDDDDDDEDDDERRRGGPAQQRVEREDTPSSSGNSSLAGPSGTRRSRGEPLPRRATIEYWIVNPYKNCITLRHYLMMDTVSWPQLIKIAHGIMCGIHFLHDNAEYTYGTTQEATRTIDGYIRSTQGALKRVAFRDNSGVLHLKPQLSVTIIHRNLSSLNIVLGPNYIPKIWNFGFAYIYHPFQPVNFDHFVDAPIKEAHMLSAYSPPEVLSERSYFTYQSLKSHDLYSCGFLFWELMSRCVLPPIEGVSILANNERMDPPPYLEPFAREFLNPPGGLTREMIYTAVCRYRTRPILRAHWMAGKKTNRFVQLIRELWDQDYEARITPCTVIDRLERTSLKPLDKLNNYVMANDRQFDYAFMWPPEAECHRAPRGSAAKKENIVFESLEDLRILEELKEKQNASTTAQPTTTAATATTTTTTTATTSAAAAAAAATPTATTSTPKAGTSAGRPRATPPGSGDNSAGRPATLATPIRARYKPQASEIGMTSRISPIKASGSRTSARPSQAPSDEPQPTTSKHQEF